MRSLLFVPGDDARKQEKCHLSKADVFILDLEDSVAPARKPVARTMVLDFLKAKSAVSRAPLLYVRVNAFDTGLTDEDLAAVMPGKPDGLLLPKAI